MKIHGLFIRCVSRPSNFMLSLILSSAVRLLYVCLLVVMSVTDPLLKEFKGHLLALLQSAKGNGNKTTLEVTDENPELVFFCSCLEVILSKGLRSVTALGFGRPGDVWTWMQAMGEQRKGATYGYEYAVNSIRKEVKVTTNVGKARLLIRTCLSHRCLFKPVEMLVRNRAEAAKWFYMECSIVGHEILGEIFLSLLLQVGQIAFHLDLGNALFLDETWLLSKRITLEFVPTKELGLCVLFINGKAMIVERKEYSVAAENDQIEVGDLIDELNGKAVGTVFRGQLSSLMRCSIGKPTTLSIVKGKIPGTNEIYPPANRLRNHPDIKPELRKKLNPLLNIDGEIINNEVPSSKLTHAKGIGYPVTYVGCVTVEERGDYRMIEGAIEQILASEESGTRKPVLLEFQDMNVKISCQGSSETIFRTTFMEISSCGGSHDRLNYFGFIAGNASCDVATKFSCHVFHSSDPHKINIILQNIAQGFQRTHFVV